MVDVYRQRAQADIVISSSEAPLHRECLGRGWRPRTGPLGPGLSWPPGALRCNANSPAETFRVAVPGPRTPPPQKIAGAGTPTFLLSQGASFDPSLTQASFDPSGRRSVEQIAAAVSTGRQPSRGAMPQLIPDSLPPDVHLRLALSIRHPYCAAPSCTVAVRYSVRHATESAASMVESRGRFARLSSTLRTLLMKRTNASSTDAILTSQRCCGRSQNQNMSHLCVICNS